MLQALLFFLCPLLEKAISEEALDMVSAEWLSLLWVWQESDLGVCR
jgi:hypothetical protein